MLGINALARAVAVNLLPPGAITASADGGWIDTLAYEGEEAFVLECEAASAGTNPTYDCKIQHSDDGSTSAGDVTGGGFTQVTNARKTQVIALNKTQHKRYVRLSQTVGGTASPSFARSATLIAQKKY